MLITPQQVYALSLNQGKQEICIAIANFQNKYSTQFKLDTPMRLKHFLGQTCIESGFFSRLEESLYYTTGQRLMEVWPSRFTSLTIANQYTRNPQKLANFVYGGRMHNTGPDDGWRYRGSSIKQVTGKENFTSFNEWIKTQIPNAPDFVAYPDLMRTPEWAIWPAVWYWTARNCYYFADRDDAKGLTRAINGGLTGYDVRVKATALAAKILNIQTDPPITTVAPKQPDPLLKEMQGKLQKLSSILKIPALNPGAVDGWNGPATEKAVRAMQSYAKLSVDGKCGPNTRKAINTLCDKYGIR